MGRHADTKLVRHGQGQVYLGGEQTCVVLGPFGGLGPLISGMV